MEINPKDLLGSGKIDDISLLHMSIQNLVFAVEKTNVKIEKTNDKVDKLSEIISKQAILFERLTNIENNFAQSVKHIHSRISDADNDIIKIKDTMNNGCPSIRHLEEKREISLEQINQDKISTKEEIKSIKAALKEIQEKPAKRWDGMIGTIITVIVTSLVTGLMLKLGFNIKQ